MFQKFPSYTRVVPRLVLVLSRWTSNTIYWNSNKVHVFCSSLSVQQAPIDVRTSNRSQATDGFMKTISPTALENEKCKKRTKNWRNVRHLEAWEV